MPRVYLPVSDFGSYPAALMFSYQVAQLQAVSGALDRLLARASRRVDGFCHKRIGAPPLTTIGTGGIAQGGTSLPITSTLGFDNGQEEAVLLNPGGANQEIVPLVPGGVSVSNWTPPYPGTLAFTQRTVNAHSAGEPVQGLYQEVSTVGSSSSSDIYSSSLLQLNQAAQLAAAHAPQFDTSGLTRVIFLKQYPILKLYQLEHMLPIDTVYSTLDFSQVGIHPSAGYLRLPLGSFVLPEGLFRSTYTAGFTSLPEEIAEATSWYAADELQDMLSQGAYQATRGKQNVKYSSDQATKSRFVQKAEEILSNGNYRRMT